MDVGVDLGVAALAHLLDRPRDVRGREVVEQHAVGHLAGQAQHPGLSAPTTILGRRSLALADAEPEALDPIEVALEVDLLAGEALLSSR